jgi:hypothetical protein
MTLRPDDRQGAGIRNHIKDYSGGGLFSVVLVSSTNIFNLLIPLAIKCPLRAGHKEILKNIAYWHIKVPVFLPCLATMKNIT